jgi:hypothetical protein
MRAARGAVIRAVLLWLLAIGVLQFKLETSVFADSECWYGDCYIWTACNQCPDSGCGYFCWSCIDLSYGCSPG